jgi:hypothetical protein
MFIFISQIFLSNPYKNYPKAALPPVSASLSGGHPLKELF